MSRVNRVYICDDDLGHRESLQFLFAQNELEALSFASGPVLLSALDVAPVPVRGVFLLDVGMSPMTGPELHDALLERGYRERNPVVFLSGKGDIALAVNAVRSKGAYHFIEKPHAGDDLVKIVRQALEAEASWQVKASRRVQLAAMLASLSPQQSRLLPLIARGDSEGEMS